MRYWLAIIIAGSSINVAAAQSLEIRDYDVNLRRPPYVWLNGTSLRTLAAQSVQFGSLGLNEIVERPVPGSRLAKYQGEKFKSQDSIPPIPTQVSTNVIQADIQTIRAMQNLSLAFSGQFFVGVDAGRTVMRDITGSRKFTGQFLSMQNPREWIKQIAAQKYSIPNKPDGCYNDALFTDPDFRFVTDILTVSEYESEQTLNQAASSNVKITFGTISGSRSFNSEIKEKTKLKISGTIGYATSVVCFSRDGTISDVKSDYREARMINVVRRPSGCRRYPFSLPRRCR